MRCFFMRSQAKFITQKSLLNSYSGGFFRIVVKTYFFVLSPVAGVAVAGA